MPRANVSQREFDDVIRAIEQNSCYRFAVGSRESGAYLIPVGADGVPYASPFYVEWDKLKGLAETLKDAPQL